MSTARSYTTSGGARTRWSSCCASWSSTSPAPTTRRTWTRSARSSASASKRSTSRPNCCAQDRLGDHVVGRRPEPERQADPARRPLRHRLQPRHPRRAALARRERPGLRPRRLRHEGRHRDPADGARRAARGRLAVLGRVRHHRLLQQRRGDPVADLGRPDRRHRPRVPDGLHPGAGPARRRVHLRAQGRRQVLHEDHRAGGPRRRPARARPQRGAGACPQDDRPPRPERPGDRARPSTSG